MAFKLAKLMVLLEPDAPTTIKLIYSMINSQI